MGEPYPSGGVTATWSDWKQGDSGMKLSTSHTISGFGMELDLGDVKAYNPKADALAQKVLKAIKHEAYKKNTLHRLEFCNAQNLPMGQRTTSCRSPVERC